MVQLRIITISTIALVLLGCSFSPSEDYTIEWGCKNHDLVRYISGDEFDKEKEILIMTQRTEQLKDGIACQVEFIF